jgi:hypothetical protein
MKSRVLASLGLSWGVAILLYGLFVGLHGTPGRQGGELAAMAFAVWLIYRNARTLIRALNGGTGPSPPPPA